MLIYSRLSCSGGYLKLLNLKRFGGQVRLSHTGYMDAFVIIGEITAYLGIHDEATLNHNTVIQTQNLSNKNFFSDSKFCSPPTPN